MSEFRYVSFRIIACRYFSPRAQGAGIKLPRCIIASPFFL
ncbi:hypothetical protein AB28_3820 [Raoultella ornithinolytica 2-156-04_S1_C2]|nr:hypothetical protein AB00_3814 [Raoultella ornithinolytica 2-156-04_S1_C1]KDX12579.1 hypothetical protein AB28_3820 [Raoultella ornithinolytica 2-156-04_S1_C2]